MHRSKETRSGTRNSKGNMNIYFLQQILVLMIYSVVYCRATEDPWFDVELKQMVIPKWKESAHHLERLCSFWKLHILRTYAEHAQDSVYE